jgi:1-acyl-sn-glycerol-3-phosphate acyltransferase
MADRRSWFQRFIYDLTQVAARLVGRLFFGLRLRGTDKFPTLGGALVCSNHQSYFDPILVGAFCPRRMNYLARENLFYSRWFGGLIRFYDAIPVKRDGMSISGLKETLRRLKRGELVLIFPEGTRTEDGEIAKLKNGFCLLARKANVPLVPVGIAGAFDVWPKAKRFPRFARICLEAGEPISPEMIDAMDDDQLVALLQERICGCFASARTAQGRHSESTT